MEAHHRVNGPNTGRNSGGRWIKNKPDSKTSVYSNLESVPLNQSYFFVIQDLFDEDDVTELMAAEATDDCGETKRKQRRFKRKRIIENRSILDTMDQVQKCEK